MDFKVEKYVLICGFPRSGTTWLSKILDSVPSTYLISEPDKAINSHLILGSVPHCLRVDDDKWKHLYHQGIKELLSRVDCNLISYPFFKKEYLAAPYELYYLCAFAGKITNSIIKKFLNRSIALPRFLNKNDVTVDLIWKSVNQSTNLNFLKRVFPSLRVIYVLRNPYATITSSLTHESMKLDGHDYRRICERRESPFFEGNEIDLQVIRDSKEIEKRAWRWRIECESAVRSREVSEDFHLILYEELVSDPIKIVGKLFDWLGWKIPAETETFLLQSTGQESPPWISRIFSSGYFGVYRKPGGNIEGWKNRLTEREYELVSGVLKESPLLRYWPASSLSKG
jgi:hypothetical protein